jgi:hypothetical protein
VFRSTKVAIKLLPEPAIKSPSQCPGTARSSTSAGLSRIDIASLNLPKLHGAIARIFWWSFVANAAVAAD